MMRKTNSKIGVIVVLYNWSANILRNINTYANFFDEVILVDNSDKETIGKINPKYDYIKLGNNYGIGRALNEGIKFAQKQKLDLVVTMDQDSKMKNNLPKIYRKILETKDPGKTILMPSYEVSYLRDNNKAINYIETKLLVQSGAIFQLNIFEKIGLFNENLFIDVVDYEFGIRAQMKGIKILQYSDPTLIHNPGSAGKKKIFHKTIRYAEHNPIRVYYQARNLLWTFKKYRVFKILNIYFKLFLKICLLYNHKKDSLKMFFRGTKDAMNNNLGKVAI